MKDVRFLPDLKMQRFMKTPWVLIWLSLLLISHSAEAQFVYFLDILEMPDKSVVMPAEPGVIIAGNTSSKQRQAWVNQKLTVGTTVGFDPNKGGSHLPWLQIQDAVKGSYATDADRAKAILVGAGAGGDKKITQIPDAFPDPKETSVIYMQDTESNFNYTYDPLNGQSTGAAAYIALFWAARQLLGESFRIIPIISNAYLILPPGTGQDEVNIPAIVGPGGVLEGLKLAQFLPAGSDANRIDLLSFLYRAGLIDGFLGEQYSPNNPQAPIGDFACGTTPIYDPDLPWAILSDMAPGESQFSGKGPYSSNYWKELPFEGGLYFGGDVSTASSFKTAGFMTPTPSPSQWQNTAGYCPKGKLTQVQNSKIKLTIRVAGGSGTVLGQAGEIDCRSDCAQYYAKDAEEVLTAKAASGYRFGGWSCKGRGCPKKSLGQGSLDLVMKHDEVITARFIRVKTTRGNPMP